jgi:DNA polymerase-3 subunit gamma/tau
VALYRTYRPATFAEVVGQEHVTDPLSRALDGGRINHAYLFSGPRGCGKTSSARILARSLNCAQGPTSTPCGTCSSCVALSPGGPGNLDVIELDAASHGGVDDTRELRDRAFYAPSESRYRVFIVDEAHMVTNAGFNALLKIVEEPPEHLIFVFATTEPEKVLPTIRSRTHHYPFRLLAPPVMRGLLENICAKEHVTVAPDVYPLVIRAGGGSPRDSLSILDQLLAGAGDDGVTYDRALALLGVTDVALIDNAIDGLAAGDGASVFATVERLVDAGHDPRRFAIDLLERLRRPPSVGWWRPRVSSWPGCDTRSRCSDRPRSPVSPRPRTPRSARCVAPLLRACCWRCCARGCCCPRRPRIRRLCCSGSNNSKQV